MSRKNNLVEIWDVYRNSLMTENKNVKFGTKQGKGAVSLDDAKAGNIGNEKTSGPANANGAGEVQLDPKKIKKGKKTKNSENLYDVEKFSSEKFDESIEKTYREDINNSMKSVFDKLFEEVMDSEMDELNALGVDTEGDMEDMDDMDDMGDTVTLTLDRETAQKLCDMLSSQLEGEDDMEDDVEDEDYDDVEDEDYEDMEDEEDDDMMGEATEIKELPSSAGHKLTNRKNKVSNLKASGGKGAGKIKKQSDPDGSELSDTVGHKMTKRDNKVRSTKTSKVGSSFFG